MLCAYEGYGMIISMCYSWVAALNVSLDALFDKM
jgi:hypothetical protein